MSTLSNPALHAAPGLAMPAAAPVAPLPAAPIGRVPVYIDEEVLIPAWVVDLESFRVWAKSDDYPTSARFSFIDGMLWVDRSMEEFFTHNLIKTEYTGVLGQLTKAARIGYFGSDGNLWTNVQAGISTEPDSLFIAYESLTSGRVTLVEGKTHGYIEIEGPLDMVLEIVSNWSVKKDTKVLKDKCAIAGVREYWLVDARGEQPKFDIFFLQDGKMEPVLKNDGWVRSAIFGKEFKLEKSQDPLGHPRFDLLVR